MHFHFQYGAAATHLQTFLLMHGVLLFQTCATQAGPQAALHACCGFDPPSHLPMEVLQRIPDAEAALPVLAWKLHAHEGTVSEHQSCRITIHAIAAPDGQYKQAMLMSPEG